MIKEVTVEGDVAPDAVPTDDEGREILEDFGVYYVALGDSISLEIPRKVYLIINRDTGVIEEETSVLVQALVHAGQFNAEIASKRWKRRVEPSNVMTPQGAELVRPN